MNEEQIMQIAPPRAWDSYYILDENSTAKGPFTLGQMRSLWSAGSVTRDTFYCHEGDAQWKQLSRIQSMFEICPQRMADPVRVEITQPVIVTINPTIKRLKIIASLLMICSTVGIVAFPPIIAALSVCVFMAGFALFVVGRMLE
jgi:hypothetical protein